MQRVISAVVEGVETEINKSVVADAPIDCRRLFHGRGHCYQDLGFINVDWYPPVIVITLYQEIEEPLWLQLLSGIEGLKKNVNTLLVQRRYLRGAPIDCVWGTLPEKTLANEQGMQFLLNFSSKQNIGFFLDMSPGRQWVSEHSENKRVLNLFSYTCSLSVAAIAGGARGVVNVDMSSAALSEGRENHRLNGHTAALKRDIQFMPYDIFRSWKNIIKRGPYEVVVIDPPSRQKGSFVADKDYVKVLRRLTALMPEGGDVLLCLNAPQLNENFLLDMMQEQCPQAQKIARLANREDFPERDSNRNVKMIHYRLPESHC